MSGDHMPYAELDDWRRQLSREVIRKDERIAAIETQLALAQAIKQIEDMGWTLLHDVLPNDEQTHIVYIFESGKEFPFRHFTTGPDKYRAVLNMLENLKCDDCGRNIPVSEFDENTPGLCLSCYRQKVQEVENEYQEAAE